MCTLSVEKDSVMLLGGEDKSGSTNGFLCIDMIKHGVSILNELEHSCSGGSGMHWYYFNDHIYLMYV